MKTRIQQRVIDLMTSRGMTQKQLAELAGVSEVTITKIKRGGNIDLATLYKVEEALDARIIIVKREDLI